MTPVSDPRAVAEPAAIDGFASAVASDLELIASLHEREWTAAVIAAARACPVSEQLALVPATPVGIEAMAAFDAALAALPSSIDQRVVDEMASDYADIYLRHFHRAAPTESVWLTEDGLVRQEPMFQVQAWYRRNGLRLADGEKRSEDHIVLELRFLAHLFSEGAKGGADAVAKLADAARFLDAHPLRWFGLFAARLGEVGASPVFAALARLTVAHVEAVREALVEITGVARAVPAPAEADQPRKGREKTCGDPDERPFVPGIAPSW